MPKAFSGSVPAETAEAAAGAESDEDMAGELKYVRGWSLGRFGFPPSPPAGPHSNELRTHPRGGRALKAVLERRDGGTQLGNSSFWYVSIVPV